MFPRCRMPQTLFVLQQGYLSALGILERFLVWANAKWQALEATGMTVRARLSPLSDNPSVVLDIDTNTTVARITVWSDGNCFMEALDVKTDNELFASNLHLDHDNDFSVVMIEFFNALSLTK